MLLLIKEGVFDPAKGRLHKRRGLYCPDNVFPVVLCLELFFFFRQLDTICHFKTEFCFVF